MRSFLAFLAVIGLVSSSALAAETNVTIPLWDKGATGFEDRRNEPEEAKDYWVRNIHNPSITVFQPPKEKANGAAVLICPGGGHRLLVYTAEGVEPAKFLNTLGVTAFVLKYRLGRETNSVYSIEKHAREDGQRAMRIIRSRAEQWNVDPHRVGIMGFSAGGEVVSMVTFPPSDEKAEASDEIDRLSAHPDFQVMVYPGPLGLPEKVPSDAPQAFLVVANDDRGAAGNIVTLLERYRLAGARVEAHIFAQGKHAFNMGNRSKLISIKGWPQRLADWMSDSDILKPPSK